MSKKHLKVKKGIKLHPQTTIPSDAENGDVVYDNTLGKFRGYQDGSWGDFVSGSSSVEVNYIKNASIENDASGYTTYDDGGSYVDGTGGSPTAITVDRTTVTAEILRGAGSLKISKAASDATGEGVSIATETIGIADRGKSLNGSFEIDFTDTNYTSSDIVLKAYDITNAVEITNLNDQAGTISKSKGIYYFSVATQTNTEQVRLSFHTETDSATGSAWDIFVDDVQLGPDNLVQTGTITQWETFTPTGSLTTNVTYSGKKRRVGDSEEYDILLSFSGVNTQGAVNIDIADGKSIDVDKLNSTTIQDTYFGETKFRDQTQGGSVPGFVRYLSTTSVALMSLPNSSGSPHVTSAVDTNISFPVTVAASDNIRVRFTVPIEGWGSGALISTTEALFSTAPVKAEGNAGTALTADVTDIDFNTTTEDPFNLWDGTEFVAPKDSDYLITGGVRITTNTSIRIDAYVNGSVDKKLGINGAQSNHSFAGIIKLARGDALTIRSGTSVTLLNQTNEHWIAIKALPDNSVFTVTGEKARAKIYDSKSAGTDGGTATAGFGWETRTLNSIEESGPSFITLSSNQMTLSPGKYSIQATAPGQRVDEYVTRLRNITDSVDTIIGQVANSGNVTPMGTHSEILGFFTIAKQTTFEIQMRVTTTRATDGWGENVNLGVEEIYTQVELVKIA